MPGVLKISEAASLALHTVVCLSVPSERPVPARSVAKRLGVSEAHLSKVLQRLSKAGIVRSTRGPRGGFRLARDPDSVTLLDVYEAIEGPVGQARCLLGQPVCQDGCVLGSLVQDITERVRGQLAGARLSDLGERFGSGNDDESGSEDR